MKVHTLFTTRHDGDMRKKSMSDAVVAEQIHGNSVAVVSFRDMGKTILGVDGLVSKEPVRLVVHTADCVPILAYDEGAGVIGAAHAGWRGTLASIAKNLIVVMRSLGATPKNTRVILGPHIGACCYDVPKNRADKFSAHVIGFFNHAWHIDIGMANYRQLTDVGIVPKNISVSDQCTACHSDRYFSYRKDTNITFGEQMGVIWIGKR